MADSSFDIVSKIDRMELDNAINQAVRELDTRFDFKGTGTKLEMSGEKINIESETEERAKADGDRKVEPPRLQKNQQMHDHNRADASRD